MRCDKIIKNLEDWAPKPIAWDKDNVGLQVGSLARTAKNILLCLDIDDNVIDEASEKKCNLIISHHPLLFKNLKNIDIQNDKVAGLIEKLIKKDITAYSAHTNLDFTKDGVSFQLAKKLKLQNQRFLSNLSSNQYKLAVYIPDSYFDKVADSMHKAGAGVIGQYSNCSFRSFGTGTFKGSEKSNPKVGIKGRIEKVNEVKLEVLVNTFDLSKVIAAMKESHPYEEVAYDVYPLVNENTDYGIGVLGELNKALTAKSFLSFVLRSMNIRNFRYCKGSRTLIKKVAVCGGSGSDLLNIAIKNGADVFITADVKYHTFQEAENKIFLIDAGHYETEIFLLDELKRRIENSVNNKIKVYKYSGSTNPIVFYYN